MDIKTMALRITNNHTSKKIIQVTIYLNHTNMIFLYKKIRTRGSPQGGAGDGSVRTIDGGYDGDGKTLSKPHLHMQTKSYFDLKLHINQILSHIIPPKLLKPTINHYINQCKS